MIKKVFLLWEKKDQKRDKNFRPQFFLNCLVLLALAGWLYFYLVTWALDLMVELAINRVILIRDKITISFLELFLWRILIRFQRYCIAKKKF